VRLFKLLALLIIALQLRALLPLPVTLRWSSGWAVLTISCGCLGSCERRRWRRCTTCNTATCGRISVMLGLVRTLVSIAWRASAILDNGSRLWWWTTWASAVWWKRSWGRLTRWAGQSSRRWRWGRWNTPRASMWTVVGVRDIVRLLRLLKLLRLMGRSR
jgi:hypothetical protein